ncbi:MAG: hypothetical protein C9356_14450 [Oleiphilus sp.]|nr:MAG: hypothetical protein C9356_14450 [Oleiphilus sp.]
MKIDKKLMSIAEQLLGQVDNLGYQLDAMGVENQVNRHNLIAMMMFGQKRIEGEVDSLTARVESRIAQVESVIGLFQKYVKSGVDLAAYPATYALERLQGEA